MSNSGKKTLVLLDAHAIIHRAYHALPDFSSSSGEPTGALYGLASMLMKLIDDFKPDYIVACYDLPGKTFRHEAYEAYKGKRIKADDNLKLQLDQSHKIFEAFNIPIYDAPGFEADDVLGTIVEQLKNKNINIIIASGDMDTMQLVDDDKVRIYTLKKGITDTILYDEKKVTERFGFPPALLPDYKGLRGDNSDNIVGIKGIGEKTATTLIQKFGTIEEIYSAIGGSASGGEKTEEDWGKLGITPRILKLLRDGEEEAVFSKTLAKIRRDVPIKFSIPEKTFWQNADLKKIEKMFAQFEFRSLFARLKNFFHNGSSENLAEELKEEEAPQVESQDFEETALALSLLDSDLGDPTMQDILLFAKTENLEDAKKYILTELKDKKLTTVYEEIEKPIMAIVKNMGRRGILIDKRYFADLSKEYHAELDKIKKKIYKMADTEFNINSPKQLGEVLFGKLGLKSSKRSSSTGALSTRIEVLEELAEENEIIGEIMAYRELQKLLSTYIDVIPKMVAPDGRLHSRFIQNGATTGRFSSENPNLQNLPIKSELGRRIRNGFIAEEGYKLVAFDYSQIELRVAAILSGDKKMTQIFREGKDIHAGVASFVFGVPIEKVTNEMRRKAKVINFGIIYGMGVTALRKNIGGTRDEAQKFYDNYFNQFSGVREYLDSVKAFAIKNSYTETLFGRKRYFPNIRSKIPFLKNMAERTATNAPLQGTAADIIKLAIRFADEDIKKAGLQNSVYLLLQVHDELVYEVKEEALGKTTKIIKSAMEGVLERSYLHYKTDIPLSANFGAGLNLGEVK